MSGISSDALSKLISESSSGEKVFHINNIVRFAILREGRDFNAVGGPWDIEIDGGDPSAEDMPLIRTDVRCAKESVQVNLEHCLKWNPFLEIYPHGSTDTLPFATMGSGSLAAMSIFESKYREGLTSRKMQEQGWKPRWFTKESNSYRYIGGYWEARERCRWESCLDIFGQVPSDPPLTEFTHAVLM